MSRGDFRLDSFLLRCADIECPERPHTRAEFELKHVRDEARSLLAELRAEIESNRRGMTEAEMKAALPDPDRLGD